MKNIIYNLNVPRGLRRGSWMRDHDFDPWFRILLWVTDTKDDRSELKILLKRIRSKYISQGKRRNLKQVFSYLKEVYTICVSVKVGNHYDPKMRVKVGKVSGIPLIIPGRLRKRMMSERKLYIAIMTLLGIHRVIPWWPLVDYSTIIEKFNGSYRTLAVETLIESKRKLCELAGVKDAYFSNLRAVALLPESAGPNASIAFKGVVEDGLAISRYPSYAWSLIKWFWLTRSLLMLFSFLATLTFCYLIRATVALKHLVWQLSWKVYFILFDDYGPKSYWARWVVIRLGLPIDDREESFFKGMALAQGFRTNHIGRVTAVYNTAGKARVIGITNWWTQVALYPLHRDIFKFLEGLPTDGTYDQLKPVKTLVDDGSTYYSYDLSAATDRLPRDIQTDVLKLFIGNDLALIWTTLVDMPFGKSKDDSEVIHYSVGQPMGAYSSWAMLALTHHMIVQASGPEIVRKYAVLGDDVIVSNDAPRYLELMTGFGVSISLAKSICSSEFIEFAKRVRTLKGEDYSIIGPGLIMSAVRNRYLSAVVLADALRKDIVRWTSAPKVFKEMPGKDLNKRKRNAKHKRRSYYDTTSTPFDFGSWVLFGPKGLISSNLSFALAKEGSVRVIDDLKHESMFFKIQIREYLRRETHRKWIDAKNTALNVLNSLTNDLWSLARSRKALGWTLSILYYLALWVTPVPYFIIRRYGAVLESVSPWDEKQYHKKYIDDIILDALDGFPEMQISALEPLTRREANNILRFYDGMLRFDPDAVTLHKRELAAKAEAKRLEAFYRHRELLSHLASHRPVSRTHGPSVPQDRQDNLKEGFKPFDINDI